MFLFLPFIELCFSTTVYIFLQLYLLSFFFVCKVGTLHDSWPMSEAEIGTWSTFMLSNSVFLGIELGVT